MYICVHVCVCMHMHMCVMWLGEREGVSILEGELEGAPQNDKITEFATAGRKRLIEKGEYLLTIFI